MTYQELYQSRSTYFNNNWNYIMQHYALFNYDILNKITYRYRAGRGTSSHINDCIIMADTETSKKPNSIHNHVVAWTISIRAFNTNICTLYGHKPSEFVECIVFLLQAMPGDQTIIYFHNYAYDYIFLRKFLFKEFGYPAKQLNTKSHYPILHAWGCGLVIKDSLILAQRKLEKWAIDLDVEHKKAIGCWDYSKMRTQYDEFTTDELKYIENDTLAGVECIQKTMDTLNKNIFSMPYTATGIPRERVRKIAKANRGRKWFESVCLTYNQYRKLEKIYHGGYAHANRWYIDDLLTYSDFGYIKCKDFTSSYPYVMISEKYPCEKFSPIDDCEPERILQNADNYAYMFKLIVMDIELKDKSIGMPALQYSKAVASINAIVDNGRILQANYVEIYLTEMDLKIISNQYKWHKAICIEVEVAAKDYLPRWFTDYVFECFIDKSKLKGGDPVLYSIAKSIINCLYGMTVQKNIKVNIQEDFDTGEFDITKEDPEESYQTYLDNKNSILPYFIGVWVTAYALYNLTQLWECVDYTNGGDILYSDTDSGYAFCWNENKVKKYNNLCKEKLRKNNYGPAIVDGEEYWLGLATSDGDKDIYSEFKVLGSKRYAGRCCEDNELHITVAGVPKKGAACLKNDLNNFTAGMVFDGITTGKLLHTYNYVDDIYIDEQGNETGDSIDLSPCDYLLNSVDFEDFDSLFTEENEVQTYEE